MDIGRFILGVLGIWQGAKSLGAALKSDEREEEEPKLKGHRAPSRSQVKQAAVSTGRRTVRTYQVSELRDRKSAAERVRLLIPLVQKGRRDPKIREFAVKLLSQRCGDTWCTEEKNWRQEVEVIFRALKERYRYVHDPVGIDHFSSARKILETGGEDCLPEGTQILVRPGVLAAIEDISPGDYIADGKGWTQVLRTIDKGVRPLRELVLNNGSTLRCTDDHRVIKVPKGATRSAAVESLAQDVDVGEDLLQPCALPCGRESLPTAIATLVGAYISEGCLIYSHGRKGPASGFEIAGIPNGKGLRERVITAGKELGLSFKEYPRFVRFHTESLRALPIIALCGSRASEKQFPTLDLDETTLRVIVECMNLGDGGWNKGNFCYSTISHKLARQYRVAQRMLGNSTYARLVRKHGGFGSHPIWRVYVRGVQSATHRPWAKVRSISRSAPERVYDLTTASGLIYLPENDVIVHNCDGAVVLLASVLGAVGYETRFVIVEARYSSGETVWHIYLEAKVHDQNKPYWLPLDLTVNKGPGWEPPREMIKQRFVFPIPA